MYKNKLLKRQIYTSHPPLELEVQLVSVFWGDFLCVELWADYLLIRLHGVVV